MEKIIIFMFLISIVLVIIHYLKKNRTKENIGGEEFKLIIDYTKTVQELLNDAHIDLKNDDINDKNFPVSNNMIGKKLEVKVKSFNFNSVINSDELIVEMAKQGYRPANLIELLFFAKTNLKKEMRFTIFAIGSVFRGSDNDFYVPCLRVKNCKKMISINWFDNNWPTHHFFLGIHN